MIDAIKKERVKGADLLLSSHGVKRQLRLLPNELYWNLCGGLQRHSYVLSAGQLAALAQHAAASSAAARIASTVDASKLAVEAWRRRHAAVLARHSALHEL